MTINKTKGQTILNIGVYLLNWYSHMDSFMLYYQEAYLGRRQES
uniref:Uncharacterized protein n=1 Tax=Arundo donax TaxID=35708 RepID=A0A0A8Y5N2_ARUDO